MVERVFEKHKVGLGFKSPSGQILNRYEKYVLINLTFQIEGLTIAVILLVYVV